MDLYDELDDREKEKDGMILEIGAMKVEIPEELVEERAKLMHIDSDEQNIFDMKETITEFLGCFTPDELKDKNTMAIKIVNHLKSELELYKW